MNDAVFWRLVWKEYRFQRGFWVSIAGFTFLGQLIALLIPVPAETVHPGVFVLTFIMPVFYVLGCAGTLFASEHEEGTVERLRIMAASQGQLLGSKITFASVSTALLVGLLWTTALLLSRGKLPETGDLSVLLPIWGTGLFEALAWGTLFSLLCRKVIHAVILAAAAWVISLVCLDWLFTTQRTMLFQDGLAVPVLVRIGVASGVLLLATDISRRWGSGPTWSLPTPALPLFGQGKVAKVVEVESAWAPEFRRLLWQEWRQASKTIAVLCLAIYGTIGMVVALLVAGVWRDVEAGWFTVGLLVLSTLLGSRVFSGEQEGYRFRFLAHRGCSPSIVWCSKHLVWLTASFVTSWLVCLGVLFELDRRPVTTTAMSEWQCFLFLPPLNYCVGQLVSMLARRGLYTVFLSLVLAAALDGWVYLMFSLGVSFTLSVVPIPFALLLATWVHTSDWMLERKSWAARLRLLATLGVPTIALLSGVVAYRVYQIPAVALGFSLAEYLRPITADEAATAELYRQAITAFVPIELPKNLDGTVRYPTFAREGWEEAEDFEKQWLESNRETLRLTLQAAAREECVLQDPATREWYAEVDGLSEIQALAPLLLLDARRLESEVKLDEAMDRYLAIFRMSQHIAERGDSTQYLFGQTILLRTYDRMLRWAADPSQATERVVRALRELQALNATRSPISDVVKTEFLVMYRSYTEENATSNENLTIERHGAVFGKLWRFAPWERARAFRLIAALTAPAYRRLALIEQILSEGESYRDFVAGRGRLNFYDEGTETRQWLDTTLQVNSILPSLDFLELNRINWQTTYNAFLVRMALIDWKREHGELPSSLEELKGVYFDQLPLDPYSGKPFEYLPEGPDESFAFSRPDDFVAEPGTPLIWSIGLADAISEVLPDGRTVKKGYWAFPIPEVGGDETKGSP